MLLLAIYWIPSGDLDYFINDLEVSLETRPRDQCWRAGHRVLTVIMADDDSKTLACRRTAKIRQYVAAILGTCRMYACVHGVPNSGNMSVYFTRQVKRSSIAKHQPFDKGFIFHSRHA
ncbi:hypothetical protein J6590_101800 [Homalodisca vitripennis]|nr:hypothetical protein J6590_101800 [Homalodisca vitripennis]